MEKRTSLLTKKNKPLILEGSDQTHHVGEYGSQTAFNVVHCNNSHIWFGYIRHKETCIAFFVQLSLKWQKSKVKFPTEYRAQIAAPIVGGGLFLELQLLIIFIID